MAEKVYSGEWRERVAKLYGNARQVVYFDTPVIVDQSRRRDDHQGGISAVQSRGERRS